MVDPNLVVEDIVTGLNQPVAMDFLAGDDFFVTEKATGQVKRVLNGAVHSVVLDLAVNSSSERGLLGIALHPQFPTPPQVFLFWTESSSGTDSNSVGDVPLLGHRVDRYLWNGSTLVFDANLLRLRAFQEDLNLITNPADPFDSPAPLQRGNHNGGIVRFGQDGMLYVVQGDTGRRGWTQNNLAGPLPDDQFGGPLPDDAHCTGAVFRIDTDGNAPTDNPLYYLGQICEVLFPAPFGTQLGYRIKRLFAYGIRNSIGMAFDPYSGDLWTSENAGRAYDEINRVEPGFNGGWVQIMGPSARVADFKAIELAAGYGAGGPAGLQQLRFPADLIADSEAEARSRLALVPGAKYHDPEFSWRHVVPPGGIGFIGSKALGLQYGGDLIVGSAVFRPVAPPPSVMANPGNLYRFRLNAARTGLVFTDPALQDRVADNTGRDDWVTEGSEILWGTDFGIVTDIMTAPDGTLYLVGTSTGTVRRIRHI
ncbi:MAG: PQQ-dependent sugar dehydrogenase [Planctomycetota bacterium]